MEVAHLLLEVLALLPPPKPKNRPSMQIAGMPRQRTIGVAVPITSEFGLVLEDKSKLPPVGRQRRASRIELEERKFKTGERQANRYMDRQVEVQRTKQIQKRVYPIQSQRPF